MFLRVYLLLVLVERCMGVSSPIQPFTKYDHSIELQANTAELWWTVNNVEQEITFELHIKTTGWIALGISPAGGMKGADIAVGWVDSTGKPHLQDRFAFDKVKPVVDNTTQDWFVLQGKEQNGWTALQFKRYFDSCDSMDVPIKSGTNILIFAYGLVDIDLCQSTTDITYHEQRRGTRLVPLRSYTDPPTDDMMTGYDYLDLQFDNHIIPATDTTYYCKVFKTPSRLVGKRHAIGHKVLVDPRNENLVHHLDLFECDSRDTFEDGNLIDGICDVVLTKMRMCSSIIATSWAIGGDLIKIYPDDIGYPITNHNSAKYFMIKIHYDNPRLTPNIRDSSGVRFYLGSKLRQHDLGYTIFGTSSSPAALSIPPKTEKFFVDSYCPPEATQNLPATGVTVLSALPHTHLQGLSVWTKLIRNNTAVEYLFNAENYNFNYQFENRLPKPIKIYPGDAFITRCVYSTKNKNDMTLGGSRTIDEMCSNTFSYYPLVDTFPACLTAIDETAWQILMNTTSPIDNDVLKQWLFNLSWTPELVSQWQEFYNNAPRFLIMNYQGQFEFKVLPNMPKYEDLKDEPCNKRETHHNTDELCGISSDATFYRYGLFFNTLILLVLKFVSL